MVLLPQGTRPPFRAAFSECAGAKERRRVWRLVALFFSVRAVTAALYARTRRQRKKQRLLAYDISASDAASAVQWRLFPVQDKQLRAAIVRLFGSEWLS